MKLSTSDEVPVLLPSRPRGGVWIETILGIAIM